MILRAVRLEDAAAIAMLAREMGYAETTPTVMHARLARILSTQTATAFVCEIDRTVVAWLQVHTVPLLATGGDHPLGGYAEVGGLVVAQHYRRRGIARALIDAASRWARNQGFDRLRLYNGSTRTHAHSAYRALGFTEQESKAWTLAITHEHIR